MSPKTNRMSSTAAPSTSENWQIVDQLQIGRKTGTASIETEPSALIISERRQAAGLLDQRITVSIEPASVSRRQAIRRMNEEIEGRSSPTETFASKTAG